MSIGVNTIPAMYLPDRVQKRYLLLLLGVVPFIFLYAVVNDLLLYLIIAIIGISFVFFFIRDSRVRFLSTCITHFALQVNPDQKVLGYLGAAIFTGGLLYLILSIIVGRRRSITGSALFIPFVLFLCWSSLIGILGLFTGGPVIFENWYRELLLLTPLLLLPFYYTEMIEDDSGAEKVFVWTLLTMWVLVFIIEVVKIKQNLVQSTYLFEVGAQRIDPASGALMMFVFLSILMTVNNKKKKLFLLGGFFISVVSLLLTFGRTGWITVIPLLMVIPIFGNKDERKRGYKFLLIILMIAIAAVLYGFLNIPSVRLGILLFTSKFLSATHLSSDASMYGRYVEWRQIMIAVMNSPITGYGLGSQFQNYNWFAGYKYMTGFTHNSFFSPLLKAGFIGTVFLFITYFGFIIKGITYLKNDVLSIKDRAYIRAAVAAIFFLSILGYTGNIFFQRQISLYIALYWCYCIGIGRKIEMRTPRSTTNLL